MMTTTSTASALASTVAISWPRSSRQEEQCGLLVNSRAINPEYPAAAEESAIA